MSRYAVIADVRLSGFGFVLVGASSSGGGGSSDIPAFASIDMESGKPAAVGSEWVTSRAMQLEMAGEKCIGRLLGSTT